MSQIKKATLTQIPHLLAPLLILTFLVLICNLSVQPFVGALNALDRTNFDYSPLNAVQITATGSEIVSQTDVFSLDNCNGKLSITDRRPVTRNPVNPLYIAVSDPFNTHEVHLLLEYQYKTPRWGRGAVIINLAGDEIMEVMVAAPGTHMQFVWRTEEQVWTGYVESRLQPGRGTYTVRRWPSLPEIVSSKDLGCVF